VHKLLSENSAGKSTLMKILCGASAAMSAAAMVWQSRMLRARPRFRPSLTERRTVGAAQGEFPGKAVMPSLASITAGP
jgi:ABC-type multidrug transport system ATPase subunit